MPSLTTRPRHPRVEPARGQLKRAVTYLRVSSPSQVNTDYNPEGISLPAQRDACIPKVASLAAENVREFVEPGRSATNIDQRPVFQEMLAWIRAECKAGRQIDYIVVYQFSRMFRNTFDAAVVKHDLRKLGVRIVSVTLDVGEGYDADLIETIMSAVDEHQSRRSGADVALKMGQKARSGGTLGRAPLGYRNVREQFEGREVRTVAVDPERGPLVRQAFELYATGDYTIERLTQTLADRGLRSRPGKHPAGLVAPSKVNAMLKDRYYLGYVTYKGEEFPGRHERLVTPELFERVQEVMAARSGRGVRQRIHHHYLKGLLWCGACKQAGRHNRVIVQKSTNRGGYEYFYFFCRGRQKHVCTTRYWDMDRIEEAVEEEYKRLRVAPDFVAWFRGQVEDVLSESEAAAKLRRDDLALQLDRLHRQEENLLDLVMDGQLPRERLQERLAAIADQRGRLTAELDGIESALAAGAAFLDAALDLLGNPYELYRRMGPDQRRQFNNVVFERIYVHTDRVTAREYKEPFSFLIPLAAEYKASSTQPGTLTVPNEEEDTRPASENLFAVWSKKILVGRRGLEPLTPCASCKCATNCANGPRPPTLAPGSAAPGSGRP